jgi:hypothetical protein
MAESFVGKDGFIWWKGVVEDRKDPIFLGRVRVRIFGWHTEDKTELPTEDLPWAMPSLPIDNGKNPVGLKEGDWVWGFFLDNNYAQKPIVVGYIPGIDEDKADPNVGFCDPTPDDVLNSKAVPRPPEMIPVEKSTDTNRKDEIDLVGGKFGNPDKLPGKNTAFGELTSEYQYSNYRLDLNKDGIYNKDDVNEILNKNKNQFFSGNVGVIPEYPISRYPLENRLNEPSTSRLSRNEKIEDTIIKTKNDNLDSGQSAGYDGGGLQDTTIQAKGFSEPESSYNAIYPYNHVYESESGHVIEVDDSPGAERLHWYHRSGTFKEIHPDGTQVNKVKKSEYNFIQKDYFNYSKASINFHSEDDFKLQTGGELIINSTGNINQQSGGSFNRFIKANENTKVSSNSYKVVDGESWTHVEKGSYLYIKDGDLHIKAEKNIILEAGTELVLVCGDKKIRLKADSSFIENTPDLQRNSDISTNNKANNSDWYSDSPTEASAKYGFIFFNGSPGDVWKPESDSDKKLVIVTESGGGSPIQLFEAIPTETLEAVRISYQHIDNTFTEWKVVRPLHKLGKLIDESGKSGYRAIEPFEGGPRWLHRFPKSGKEYPKQLFWKVKGAPDSQARLVIQSSERHQTATIPMPNRTEKINFNIKNK